ncbi:hypothetical protein FOA43_003830 [Brettanomyces nanus]|uniref:Tethering factor for nuclear proteasome STS1 n=1 Tax=Eeniella nana TaxID=13502 RepID=A0A875S468_EENNA|nr:uncharacterized protein FOA43_003830 [Brettanomyces nanus]QPG76441.1 hypothetical protein FOA43_003830 [Brettanomyces nanus]
MKPLVGCRGSNKRRFSSDAESFIHSLSEPNKSTLRARLANPHLRLKKQRNPEVFGQKLSLPRVLETLDKEGLQQLIMNIISEHPQLTSEVSDLSPKVTLNDALSVMKNKLQLIIDNIPYKVDPASDYSFLRVKSYVIDFFQALSDYTLNYLAPVENDVTVSIQFLIEFLTNVFQKLPDFQAIEFRYYYKLTVDKFNTIFLDSISQFVNEKKQNILLVLNENWLQKLDTANRLNHNNFAPAANYLAKEIQTYENSGSVILNTSHVENTATQGLHSSESTDSSTRLQGLNGLLNFSSDNNPLNGSAMGNVYDTI